MREDVKTALRLRNNVFDSEVEDLIEGARQDLFLSGILFEKTQSDTDFLIKRAIVTYAKANFGYDNPESDKFQKSYDMLKQHLCLAGDYIEPME